MSDQKIDLFHDIQIYLDVPVYMYIYIKYMIVNSEA